MRPAQLRKRSNKVILPTILKVLKKSLLRTFLDKANGSPATRDHCADWMPAGAARSDREGPTMQQERTPPRCALPGYIQVLQNTSSPNTVSLCDVAVLTVGLHTQ